MSRSEQRGRGGGAKAKKPATKKRQAPSAVATLATASKASGAKKAKTVGADTAATSSASDTAPAQEFSYLSWNRPGWFDLQVSNPERVLDFYREVHGWNIAKFDPPGSPEFAQAQSYYVAMSEDPSDGIVRQGINGGITTLPANSHVPNRTIINIPVEDYQGTLAKVQANGGFVGKTDIIPSVGRFALCLDTVGTAFYVMERETEPETPSKDCNHTGPEGRVTYWEWRLPEQFNMEKEMFPFYEKTFGWKFNDYGMTNFSGITTGVVEFGEWGGIGGGVRVNRTPGPGQTIVFTEVKSIVETLKKVKTNGGEVLQQRTAVPESGWLAYINDPEGLTTGLWETDKTA